MNKLKTITLVLFTSALMALPSSAIEMRVGVSAAFAQVSADGQETLKDSAVITKHSEEAHAIIPSIFAEVSTDGGFGLGVDQITGSADLSASTRTRNNRADETGNDSGTQKASAEVDGVTSIYLIKTFANGLLLKVGQSSADVNTKEALSSGTKYKNVSVDGTHYGIGYHKQNDNGFFFRTTVEHTDFDSITLTGDEAGGTTTSFNKIKANVDITAAKFSIGKTF